MFHLLIGVFILLIYKFTNILLYVYVTMYITGNSLMYAIGQIFYGLVAVFTGITVFLEEFFIFSKETYQTLHDIFTSIENSVSKSFGCVSEYKNILDVIENYLKTGKIRATKLFGDIYNLAFQILSVINGAILIIGDFIWFILNIGPRMIEFALLLIADFVYTVVNIGTGLIRTIMKDIFQYSLVVGAFFFILMYRRRMVNFGQFIIVQIANILKNFTFRIQQLLKKVRRRHLSPSTIKKKPVDPVRKNRPNTMIETPSISECVICQERPRCILLLPCKHLCMCKECFQECNSFRLNCPICRGILIDAIPVYV